MTTDTQPKHTPLPWHQSHRQIDSGGYSTQIYTEDGETIATMHWYPKDMGNGVTATCRADNAEFIVRACNAHYELLEALKLAHAALSGSNMNMNVVEKKVKSAIAKAEGQ